MEEENNAEQLESAPAEESAAEQTEETQVDQSPLDGGVENEAAAEPEPSEAPEPAREPSRREERRIEKLSDKLRQESERANAYRQQLLSQQTKYKPLDYNQAEQFDVDQLERDRQAAAQTAYQQGMQTGASSYQQEMFVDRLEIDAERVAQKYDVLNEDSDNFDPDFTANINDLYLQTVGYNPQTGTISNPNVRYKDFVKKTMDAVDRYASSRSADTARNLASQASRGGLRPSGGTRKGVEVNNPSDIRNLSDDQFEKARPALEADIKRALKQL